MSQTGQFLLLRDRVRIHPRASKNHFWLRFRRQGDEVIQALVDFSLTNRFLILTAALVLLIWGAISFHNLPVEAYPDVANNYVTIITQWPGRAAEEVEQQVSIPIEIVMNGIPHLQNLRSVSLAGLSSVTMIFDDDSINDWNRAKVVERLTQVVLPQDCNRRWDGLESGRPDLLLHPAQLQSQVRRHGAEVA